MNYNTNEPDQQRKWIIVTPKWAALVLSTRNNRNRKLQDAKIKEYVRHIVNGTWDINSPQNEIAFYKDGQLADGQNRLQAIVKTGITVPMWCVYNVDDGTVFDNGTKRTFYDQMKIDGSDISMSAISTIRFVLGLYGINGGVTKDMVEEYYRIHSEKINKAVKMCDKRSANGKHIMKNSPSVAAVYLAMVNGISSDVLEEFTNVACTLRYDSEKKNSAVLLFQYNADEKANLRTIGYNISGKRRYFSIVCQAIRDFNQGKPRKKMYQPIECDFMLNFPKYVDKDFIQKYKR